MNTRNILFCILGLFALLVPLQAQIAAGTSIQINIMGVPVEEKGKIDHMYPVSSGGTINLPFIGRMRAAGMSPEALASAIQAAYQRAEIYTNPTIQVVSTTEGGGVRDQVVHLGGYVRRSGPVKYTNTLTLWQAVQAAGGANDFGSMKRVKLIRGGKSEIHNLLDEESMNVHLQPDDVIDIPQKTIFNQ